MVGLALSATAAQEDNSSDAQLNPAAGDHLLPALYVAGLCVPFLVIASHGQAHLGELQHILTGMDVAVVPEDAIRTLAVVLPCGMIVVALWRRWLLLAQSPTTAQMARIHPLLWDLVFLGLVGTIVLMGTHTMGVVMVLALLFLPAAAALPWGRTIPFAVVLSICLALAEVGAGFYVSVRLGWPFSHSVGGIGFGMLIVSQVASALSSRARA